MAKQLKFRYKDNDYVLEFNRKTVSTLERNGFKVKELFDFPNVNLPLLWAGAFLANHKRTKREVIDEIFENIPDKENIISKLYEMYLEPTEALFDEPENEEGKIEWETTF